ncbi:nervous system development [Seminavis robusta]|uniref:Nervous system development n=1 Tax=Seminavis robusta TaxID=568900 RepID=A0A9N8E005_9STRA|nr:nervous system development [Seminavis robusta]|eukprot:Sro484_g152250.1 nervous system development (485) ;mRNA; r:32340-33794
MSKRAAASHSSAEEPSGKRGVDGFFWRGDPQETFSDWTIVITFTDGDNKEQATTYHVHKCILAHGDRKSGYFAKTFKNAFQESQECTSRIELHKSTASLFPAVLDYLYGSATRLLFASKDVIAMHSLGEYFEIAQLRKDVEDFFCQENIIFLTTSEGLGRDYLRAKELRNQTMLSLCAKHCARVLVNPGMDLADLVDLCVDFDFWVDVIRFIPDETEHCPHLSKLVQAVYRVHCDSLDIEKLQALTTLTASKLKQPHLSKLVEKVCIVHSESLGLKKFQVLTAPSKLKRIDPSFALRLCLIEDELLRRQDEGGNSNQNDKQSSLSCLQKRCAVALGKHWGGMSMKEKLEVKGPMSKLGAAFLFDVLCHSASAPEDDRFPALNNENTISKCKCCITAQWMEDPVTCSTCLHSYSREGILAYIRSKGGRQCPCPVLGCNTTVTRAVLRDDADLARRVRRTRRRVEAGEDETDDGDSHGATVGIIEP